MKDNGRIVRILAIEPDPRRAVTIERFVSEYFGADVVVTTSAGDALVALCDDSPDLILTSSFLAAGDDEQLAAHLRTMPDFDHVPVLTIPPLVETAAWDVSAIAVGIEEALAQTKRHAPDPEIDRPARLFLIEAQKALALEASQAGRMTSLVRIERDLPSERDFAEWRTRARRWNGHEVPWIAGIQLTWGARTRPTLRLRNISSTGVLVESDVDIALGNKAGFELASSDEETLIVHARVVRVETRDEDPSNVRFVVAASFERPFDALGVVRSVRELRRSQGLV